MLAYKGSIHGAGALRLPRGGGMSKNSWRYRAVLLGAVAVALVGAPGGRGEARTHVEGRPALFRRSWRASCPRS